jgi:hypothetical protein
MTLSPNMDGTNWHEMRGTPDFRDRTGVDRGSPFLTGSHRVQRMSTFLQQMLNERRSIEVELADMLAKYERDPRPPLAQTIELIRSEVQLREQRSRHNADCDPGHGMYHLEI